MKATLFPLFKKKFKINFFFPMHKPQIHSNGPSIGVSEMIIQDKKQTSFFSQ